MSVFVQLTSIGAVAATKTSQLRDWTKYALISTSQNDLEINASKATIKGGYTF